MSMSLSETLSLSETETVTIMILSGRHNFKQRELVRRYQPMDVKGFVIKFFVGNRPCRIPTKLRSTPYTCIGGRRTEEFDKEIDLLEEKLTAESKQYNDIIEVDMVDYYRALPKKLKLAYSWAIENTNAEWFFKIDDDCFYNPTAIRSYFNSYAPSTQPILIGNLRSGIGVPKSGKWAELNYKKSKYPSFPLGSFSHIVNRPLARYIQKHNDELFEYQGEDVSMGIWADENIEPIPTLVNTKEFLKSKADCNDRSWACGHEVYEKDFQRLTKFIH